MFTTGTDITTAVTDLINAAVSMLLMWRLIGRGVNENRDLLWIMTLFLFILASITGFFIHGFTIAADPEISQILQRILVVELAFTLAFFMVSVFCDVYGEGILRKAMPVCLAISTAFSIIALIIMFFTTSQNGLTIFVVYCIANLLVMIVILIKHRKNHVGLSLYLLAVILLVIANCVQMMKFIEFTLIRDFNCDSVYHWVILIFVLVQYIGICRFGDNPESGPRVADGE